MHKLKVLISFLLILPCFFLQAQTVKYWLTSGDESIKFQEQTSLTLINNPSAANVQITIDSSQHFQTIDAFGFALTQGSAQVINSLVSNVKSNLLNELFSADGLNISGLRISIGASDLSNSVYGYNSVYNDTAMLNFSLAGPDLDHVVPLLQEILLINPDIKILATPWSAPTWMKTNNAWIGGNLKSEYFAAYALYFVKYIEAMNAACIPIWAITPQNEPENPFNEPSMLMTASEQIDFIENHLGPNFQQNGINTKIIAFDHNCDNSIYPINVLNNTSFTDGAAFHLYSGNITTMSVVKAVTNKNVYFTEQYTDINGNFSGDLSWHMRNVVIGSLNNWSKTVFEWNLATDASYGPQTPGGCTVCLGALTVLNPNTVLRNVSYYILAHASKIVHPGAIRINASSNLSNVHTVAFKNEDGSISLIVYNDYDFNQSVKVVINNIGFYVNIPQKSVASFILPFDMYPCNYETLTIGNVQSTDSDFEETRIESNQVIPANVTVDYDATEYVILFNGFEAKIGAQFEAFIDGCNNGDGGLID